MSCRRSSPSAALGSGCDSARTSALARPRVLCSSSRVAMYDGHITPVDPLRHTPMFMHRSAAPRMPPVPLNESRVDRSNAGGQRDVSDALAHRWRVDDLPRIHQRMRVEEQLQLAHRRVERVAENDAVELAASEAVAVLAGVGSAEFADEVANLGGDGAHRRHLIGTGQIHERTDVQTPDRAVTVEAGHQAVSLQDGAETSHILGQAGRIDGGVLDERHRPARALARGHQQPQPGRSDLEQRRLLLRCRGTKRVIAMAMCAARARQAAPRSRMPRRHCRRRR